MGSVRFESWKILSYQEHNSMYTKFLFVFTNLALRCHASKQNTS